MKFRASIVNCLRCCIVVLLPACRSERRRGRCHDDGEFSSRAGCVRGQASAHEVNDFLTPFKIGVHCSVYRTCGRVVVVALRVRVRGRGGGVWVFFNILYLVLFSQSRYSITHSITCASECTRSYVEKKKPLIKSPMQHDVYNIMIMVRERVLLRRDRGAQYVRIRNHAVELNLNIITQ